MAERIPEEKINQIRQSVDIVEVVGEYVQLKKQGRNYFGLCPFHGENSPSFSVSPEKQIFYCFGCGTGGNVFSFLMELEGAPFTDAAMKLAARAGIELEIQQTNDSAKAGQKHLQPLYEAHELLNKFYHHILVNTKDGQEALEYLLSRGFTRESIDKFQIGYALDSWEFVTNFLLKRGFKPEEMEKAGLIIKRERDGTYFDRFRNRIMFPLFDQNGKTIAFSGRTMGGENPKYLNSPETAIFNKSKILYNFHLAKPAIRRQNHTVLFEGFADVISADWAGVENSIATMGTSLTPEHIALIRRNSQQVTVCFDSDHAGIEAAFRAGSLLSEAAIDIRIAMMPDGLDPDDYIKKYGEEKFRKEIIGGSLTWMSFKLLYYRRGKNLQNEGDRLAYIEKIISEISILPNAVEKDHYLRQLADEFSLSLDALKQQMTVSGSQNKKQERRQLPKQEHFTPRIAAELKPAYYNAERHLIAHMLRNREIAYKIQEMLKGNTFNHDDHQAIITYLFGYYEEKEQFELGVFLDYIKDEKLRRMVADIGMMSLNEELGERELNDYINQVLKYEKMLKIKEKRAQQKEADSQKDYPRAIQLGKEILDLQRTL
ncbi:DNA primase [Neobacillus notoginsengisoli]|uniref:DNA primase n=1 Tax=Neobacillus notoginsengisoli TaxID=1578198 RepID=A0A417YUU5_9BACI|nr:DNA primase [Neobacillus notoginsengisoli]RHW41029.1 DNA primase [Neobacillus notoginsengisoli]